MHPELADYRHDGFRQILTGAFHDEIGEIDQHVTAAVFDFLDEIPSLSDYPAKDGSFNRLSLATLNIERGRDHAIPSYVEMRKYCFPDNAPIKSFEDLVSQNIMPQENADSLKKTYKYVEDIDFYPGGLSEMTGALPISGPVFACKDTFVFFKI
jgi:hypothetical protein